MPSRTVNDLGGSASRKRARRSEAEDDEDSGQVVSVQRARSNLRNDNAKRVRLSSAGPSRRQGKHSRESTPQEDEPDEDAEMEDSAIGLSPPKTQYDEMRDNDFKHLEHQEADDLRATQNILRIQARAEERLGDNLVAHNGILESITCINFMCHERLHVELGPLLNFIVGENGSGKSAILTAITLCLGGKATATNRGGSLKNFIKEGCERASLSVKLKNQGDDAYRADLYGDSIIVERTFSKTGTSGFKVKSAENQIISTKKSEVDEIVEFYALQVDNPLNILSQDNARQFLNASSSAEKYKYFIEGVQLEQLDRDYRLISEFVESSVAKAPLQRERVAIAQREYNQAHRLAEMAKDSSRLKQKRRLLGYQVCWSQVADEERRAVQMDQRLVEMDEQIGGFEQAVAGQAAKMEQLDTNIAEKQAALEAAQEEHSHLDAGVEAVKATYDDAQKQLQQIYNDERNAHMEAKTARNQVKWLDKEIVKEKAKLEQSQGDEVVRQRENLEEVITKRTQLSEKLQKIRESMPGLNENCVSSQNKLNEIRVAMDEKKRDIQATQGRLRQIEGGQGGKYDAYEPGVPNLIRAIENDPSFRVKPLGPIATHVQLLDQKWSTVLENWFGGTLSSFIVTCIEDSKRLQSLMDRCNVRNCGIIIGGRNTIDTTGKEPDAQFNTVLRTLKIDNDVVRSQLVITNAIEQVLLIPERTKGEEVMFNGRSPMNVKQCICFHDTRRNEGLILKTGYQGKNLGTEPVRQNGPLRRPRMKADTGSAISAQKEILQFLQDELRDLDQRRQELQQAHDLNVAQVNERNKEIKTLEPKVKDLDKEIAKIEKHLDSFEGADARLESLTSDLEEQKQRAEHFANQYAEIKVKKENFNKEIEAKKQALAAEKEQKRVAEKAVRDAENEVKKWENLRRLCLAEKNAMHEELDMAKDSKRRMQEKRQQQEQTIQTFTERASEQAPERVHIPEGETHESLNAQYASITKQIKELQRQHGISDQDAFALRDKTKATLDKVRQDYEVSKTTVERLKRTLNQRLTKWQLMQRFISAHARSSFAYLLRERRFRGQLMINHREKQLSLRVEPDKAQKNGSGQSTKTLSGGEKSFSSICLLLSIWESMGAPLRCLDEFDVFMDNVNRAVSTKMLMTAARRSVGRQYIFITPNAIDGKNSLDKDVKIIRLGDPRQRRLADP
ncbi:P-loop containing nucleoside triphosphate hydrolase protein [Coniochaeta ligniaria NRRL 30616]|uniref:p-loop containing nucleoside triphosphate hydrolase protein n=1 Tax=Coniochaeta ligniaria NRRL 30616 TaxID=1408157 RepID=A0A1J7J0I4_9PEZI|nr:P-loop containing nucleoside triphosphate hydrolase protein [Coniochaeta ligniaria NRRL 30616]